MFNFTPLLGALSASPASQSLLELDGGIKILVDVGWDEKFEVENLKELERHVPTLSFILLTHATTAHLAAFAHCCKNIPLFNRIPVYATHPVASLGRTLFDDLYHSSPLAASIIPQSELAESAASSPTTNGTGSPNILFQVPTKDEVAGYFSRINPLKYSQPHEPVPSPFSPPLNGLTITAYSAGHSLGGTIWHIQHGMESIVYAVDWNQAREHVLSGAAWLGGAGGGGAEVIEQLRRPTALVCSSRGAEREGGGGGISKRDAALMSLIRRTVAKGGSVLIPSDSSARVLELAYLLEHEWRKDPASPKAGDRDYVGAKLYLAGKAVGSTMRLARSHLEWMDENISRELEAAAEAEEKANKSRRPRDNKKNVNDETSNTTALPPFEFKHLGLVQNVDRLLKIVSMDRPKVIIASDSSLEWGYSRLALRAMCNDDRNLVILTEQVGNITKSEKTLGRYLWDIWNERRDVGSITDEANDRAYELQGAEAVLREAKAEPLAENELGIYQRYLARRRNQQTTFEAGLSTSVETSADVADERSDTTSTSSEDEDTEHQGKILNVSAAMAHPRRKLGLTDAELGINVLLRRKGLHDFGVQGKKGREKMYPFPTKRMRDDDYGGTIQPEDYLRAEEREEVSGEDMRNGDANEQAALGQKRKWDDVATKAGQPGRQQPTKRLKEANGAARNVADAAGDSMSVDGSSEDSDEEANGDATAQPQGPQKVIITKESLQLSFRIAFVDFSGLHDKRSLHMLIPLIRPRKLVLIAGEEQETLAFADVCRGILQSDVGESRESEAVVFTPAIGDKIDASVETNAWNLRLSQVLCKKMHWQRVKDLSVVTVIGRLETKEPNDQDQPAQKKVKHSNNEEASDADAAAADNQQSSPTPVLNVVPASMAAATRVSAQPLYVGDWRLVDLRKVMQNIGLTADFQGEGTLLIDGQVAVRKSGTGQLEIETAVRGTSGRRQPDLSTFYTVKRKVYEGLAVIAAR